MGQITIQVGALSRAITAPDDKMARVLGLVVDVTGGPSAGTPAQRADWVLRIIREHLVTLAFDRARGEAITEAESALEPVDLDN